MKMGFAYEGNIMHVDGISFVELAEKYGTPLYIYSGSVIQDNFRRVAKAFAKHDPLVAYSVKSNSNLAILAMLAKEGAGFDIVSGGELDRIVKVGITGDRVIFAGVGKRSDEMAAAIKANVYEFNLESEAEAERLNEVAKSMKRKAPVAIRVNPNVDAKTHKYITTGKTENKFGISLNRAMELGKRIVRELPHLELAGLHCHVGSQILDSEVHPRVVSVVGDFTRTLIAETGAKLKSLNFGGGFGIAYQKGQKPLDLKPFSKALDGILKEFGTRLILEPGRSISAPAGVLLSRVEYIKRGEKKIFAIIDASMTELMRPTLYEAHHEILPVEKQRRSKGVVDFVGPVCESGDFLALDRESFVPQQGDLVAIMDAGAYGFVMASHYNTRPKVAEVLVLDGKAILARERESVKDLLRHEEKGLKAAKEVLA